MPFSGSLGANPGSYYEPGFGWSRSDFWPSPPKTGLVWGATETLGHPPPNCDKQMSIFASGETHRFFGLGFRYGACPI